jgi:hypothetical protein
LAVYQGPECEYLCGDGAEVYFPVGVGAVVAGAFVESGVFLGHFGGSQGGGLKLGGLEFPVASVVDDLVGVVGGPFPRREFGERCNQAADVD